MLVEQCVSWFEVWRELFSGITVVNLLLGISKRILQIGHNFIQLQLSSFHFYWTTLCMCKIMWPLSDWVCNLFSSTVVKFVSLGHFVVQTIYHFYSKQVAVEVYIESLAGIMNFVGLVKLFWRFLLQGGFSTVNYFTWCLGS